MRQFAVAIALWAACAGPASAETVYRCGPGGNSYSQVPCHDGNAFDASDRRSSEDVANARRVARTDRVLGDSLEQERMQRESVPPKVGSLSPLPAAEAKASKPKKEKKRPKDFEVKLPKQKKKSRSS